MASPRYTRVYKQLMESSAPGMRVSYTTYNTVKLQTQRAAFLLKEFLCNNLSTSAYDGGVKLTNPWTMYWSSDGTTGPSAANDNTDRITDHTKFATRVDSSTSPISYYVLRSGSRLRALWVASTAYAQGDIVSNNGYMYVCQTAGTSASSGGPSTNTQGSLITDGTVGWRFIGDGDGYLYLIVAFRSAQDYFLSITFASSLTLAATPTHFPTASTNGAICNPGGIHQRWFMGSDASGDRILQISADDDGTGFRLCAIRAADIPTNGGVVVLGHIPDEYAHGIDGSAVLLFPVFMWNVNSTALKSNSAPGTTTICGYNTSNTVGGVLFSRRSSTYTASLGSAFQDCLLMHPVGYGTTTIYPLFSTDSFSTRRRWPLGWEFQSFPMTHVAGSENGAGAIIWGTVQDMHIGTPRDQNITLSSGQLFGLRWWLYGILMMPNPSQVEPTHT